MIVIGVDVDGVLNDFCKLFVERFNEKTGKNLKREQLTEWNLKNLINKLYKGEVDGEIANSILEENFFSSLELKENVIEGMELISKFPTVKVIIVTAIDKKFSHVRDLWIKDKFGKYNIEVFYETQKDKIKMNYLIDDGVHNLDMLSKKIGKENCLCIKESYNKDCDYNRFDSLKEAFDFILKKENLL